MYRLSDAFSKKQEEPELELIVTVLNINAGNNAQLLGKCKTLREYMQYIERVRIYAEQMPIDEAVERTITECINEGILVDFLKRNRAEAMKVSIYEYNEELHLATVRKEGYEDGLSEGLERGLNEGLERGISQGIAQGITQGITKSILELLEDLGTVPENVREMLEKQDDMEKLSKWHKLAARSSSLKEFEESLT